MNIIFYICSLIAILSTFNVITHTHAMRALLNFIVSLLSISGIFFSLKASFIGALEVIIYAGAIMVLFIFVIMMLNLEYHEKIKLETFHILRKNIVPIFVSLLLFSLITYSLFSLGDSQILLNKNINIKDIGIQLLGPYLLIVELASMLLLASLIIVVHIGKKSYLNK